MEIFFINKHLTQKNKRNRCFSSFHVSPLFNLMADGTENYLTLNSPELFQAYFADSAIFHRMGSCGTFLYQLQQKIKQIKTRLNLCSNNLSNQEKLSENTWCKTKYTTSQYSNKNKIVFDAMHASLDSGSKSVMSTKWRHDTVKVKKEK